VKAFALTSAEGPATLIDLPDPDVPAGGVRVRVAAASVNGFDVFQASGYLASMMEHAYPTVIGRDFAGVVDAVADGRTDVSVGDEVLGFVQSMPPLHVGTFGEQLAESDRLVITRKPAGLSFAAAAALPLAGATALDAVDAIEVAAGHTVLVVGATGGVGSFAVQFAAERGAIVVATAEAGDDDAFVRALGATDTVDYVGDDVADAIGARFPDGIDAVIDAVNRDEAFARVAALVHDGGRIATTLGAADVDALASRGVRATNVSGRPTVDKLIRMAEQAAAGTLRVEIEKTFPLAEAAAALAAFGAGKRGKLVIQIG
jgi:NADPH2:quinone reductase